MAALESSVANAILSQLPATLLALASFIAACAAAWTSIRNAGTIAKVKETSDKTHDLINSRFSEWQRETKEAAVAAAIAAHEAGYRLGKDEAKSLAASIEQGRQAGKEAAELQSAEVAKALATPVDKPKE